MTKKHTRAKVFSILIPVAVITVLAVMAWHNLKDFNFAKTLFRLRELGRGRTTLLSLITFAAVSSMALYDIILVKSFSYRMKLRKVFKISWISNTFNNFLGFGGVTGAGTRFYLYKKNEVKDSDAYRMSLLLLPATATGLSLLSVISLAGIFAGYGRFVLSNKVLLVGMAGVSLYLLVYLFYQKIPFISKKIAENFPDQSIVRRSRYELLAASFTEWTFAFILFYSISTALGIKPGFLELLIIFTLAASGGVVSLVPGGLGSFDLIAIMGMNSLGASTDSAAAVILLYRIFYFIIPWLIGMILLLLNYSQEVGSSIREKSSYPAGIISDASEILFSKELSARLLSFFVFFSGFILLLSAAYPSIPYRLEYIARIIPVQFMALSHNISVTAGVILIILSYGIFQKTRRAFSFTLIFLALGSVFTFIKGGDFEEALFLGVIALLLFHSKKIFYRESAPVSLPFAAVSAVITFLLLLLYAVSAEYLQRFYHARLHFKVVLFHGHSRYLNNAVFAFTAAWIIILLLYILVRKREDYHHTLSESDFALLESFLQKYEGNNLIHFAFTGDKNFFWFKEKVLIMYGYISGYFIALGDPIGDSGLFSAAIEAFRDFADKKGIKTAFYQIRKDYLDQYHENGFSFIKLGEEAVVEVDKFDLSGKARRGLRTVKNRFEKEGFTFSRRERPYSDELLDRLKEISDEWLNGRKEKGFSLGKFDRDYIGRGELLLLTDSSGKIIAFVTMIPPYSGEKLTAIDLMRYGKEAPSGTMDFLFINMILWAKEMGYRYVSLEMAPLSNVGRSKYSYSQEKLFRFIYSYGSKWYNFHGLRRFKEKYGPFWIPKYLAYPYKSSVTGLLLKITRLISG